MMIEQARQGYRRALIGIKSRAGTIQRGGDPDPRKKLLTAS
ncbi:MAG TPA: hypothetical protein VLC92_18425 [Rhodocyclaceae bacterium]|nr:hypothetical protein [Rhodocyclaceae bacterium]